MAISDAEYAERQANDRAYRRRQFDLAEGERNRDVQRARVAAIEAQTAEMRELRVTLERLLLLLSAAPEDA
jgi:hypothetical protein